MVTSLDVQGAYDAAWWPAILYNVRKLECPSNLYNLTRSYFSFRVAILCANTYKKERKFLRATPKVPVAAQACGTFYTTPS